MGCNEKKTKNELIRIVKRDNTIVIDKTGKLQARGAYICKRLSCVEKLKKNKRIKKAFQINEVPEELCCELEKYIKESNFDK